MAKVTSEYAVAFAAGAEGVYDSDLDAITTTLDGDVNGDDDGLLLGDRDQGVGNTGLSISLGRKGIPKAPIGSSHSTTVDDFIALVINTLGYGFVFAGSRRTTTGTPQDSDFVPSVGFGALLEAAGFAGSALGGPVGHKYVPGGIKTASGLIYWSGNRFELQDILCSQFAITYTPGGLAIASTALEVGFVKDPVAAGGTTAAIPTLDYGAQLTVAAPPFTGIVATWKNTLRINELTITIDNTIETFGDAAVVIGGEVKERGDQKILVEGKVFLDDNADDERFPVNQLLAQDIGDVHEFTFQHGTAETTGSLPAVAHNWSIPDLMLTEVTPEPIGKKAGFSFKGEAKTVTANGEATLIFN